MATEDANSCRGLSGSRLVGCLARAISSPSCLASHALLPPAGLSIVLYYVVAPLVVENVLKESSIVFSYVGLSQPNDADFLLTASVSLDGAPSWATGSLRGAKNTRSPS